MKLYELIKKLPVLEMTADKETEVTGICSDSRKVSSGCIFVAIKGLTSDGHRFIRNAVKDGASVIICEEKCEERIPYIRVPNSRNAMALVSAAWFGYPAERMNMIGVTGTSGKTTSTHLIRHILQSTTHQRIGMIGTNGNYIGEEFIHTEYTTPDSYELHALLRRMADAGCSTVVMEVSSHSLAQDRVDGICFDVAAFTNLSQDHLDFHHNMEEYARTKKHLFSMCKKACINLDDAYAKYMMQGISCPVMTTSIERKDTDLYVKDIHLSASSVSFEAVCGEENAAVQLAIPGLFSVHNALTAISVCMQAGISLQQCAEALSSAKGVKGRVETVPVPGDYTVVIDYSHKPDALENVLKTLRPITKGRLIVLFGCGGDRDREKRPVMGKVASENSDLVVVTSDNPRTEQPEKIIEEITAGLTGSKTPYHVICDRVEAIHWVLDNAHKDDVILLAGKGHEDYQVIGHEKHHMDEREIVADYLKEKSVL